MKGAEHGHTPTVQLEGICKRRGATLILDRVSLHAYAGTVVGLVGPNGAGKSTLLRIVGGLVAPSTGSGVVLGCPLRPDRHPTLFFGFMPEHPAFVEHFSARANLRLLASIRGVIGADDVDSALLGAGLDPRDRRPVRAYSLGMRQRLSLAQATMEEPPLLLLDEPTNGLDPHGVVELRTAIRTAAHRGATVLVSSHALAEVETACDEVSLIERGKLIGHYEPGSEGEALETAYLRAVRR